MPSVPTLGARIAQARRELAVRRAADITQADMASEVGVSAATVSRWEADTAVPREDALAKLAKFLGTTPSLLRYGPPPQSKGYVIPDAPPGGTVAELVQQQEGKPARKANGGGKRRA